MRLNSLVVGFAALAAGLSTSIALAADSDWVPINPANEIYMDIMGGTVIIELHPEAAPLAVARIKELAHSGFYNNVVFHRVIDDFMAQGGDPTGTGEGGSTKPNLKAEFTFHDDAFAAQSIGADAKGDQVAIDGSTVVLTEPAVMQYSQHHGALESWLPHCRGVAAMARTDNPNSANSQFFIMLSNTHELDLDRQYTPWGHVVYGMENVDRIEKGEPPRDPTRIYKMRLGTDVPEAERIVLEELSPNSQQMHDLLTELDRQEHDRLNACDIEVPVRLAPKPGEGQSQ